MAKHKPKAASRSGRRVRENNAPRTKSGKRQAVSKKAICLGLLERAEGASIAELQEATGWQAHSVRGFLSGEIKKMADLELSSAKPDGEHRRYYVKRD